MTPVVVALILTAAVLHATWNAILRSGADRLWSITVMGTVGLLVALPFAIGLPHPAPASWAYIALSAVLQTGYSLFLVRAYRDGHLTHVYPIARGTAPLLVTLGAAVFAGEHLARIGLLGIVLVSGGIITLALGRSRPDAKSTMAALATGVFIASYMVTDGVGVRLSGQAIGYAAWQAVAQGSALFLTYIALRRRAPALPRGRPGVDVLIASVLGLVGYSVVIWAMDHGAMGKVSALRETSILFAAVIGALFLRESITPRKIIGAVAIAGGAICLSIA